MNISFKDKKALVTGAGKGIGRAIAVALLKGGAEVYALSRTASDLEDLKKEFAGIITLCCDLQNWEKTRETLESIDSVDLLVNNAGVNNQKMFMDATQEQFDWISGVNLRAPYNVTQVIAKKMIEKGAGGAIVNVSSIAAHSAFNEHTIYSATKAGLNQLTKNLAVELGKYKIRVNGVSPTVAMTPLGKKNWSDPKVAAPMLAHTPLGRFAEIDEIVGPVLFLLSDQAAMITGTILPIDGGFTVM